jgi:hypothetical protein
MSRRSRSRVSDHEPYRRRSVEPMAQLLRRTTRGRHEASSNRYCTTQDGYRRTSDGNTKGSTVAAAPSGEASELWCGQGIRQVEHTRKLTGRGARVLIEALEARGEPSIAPRY